MSTNTDTILATPVEQMDTEGRAAKKVHHFREYDDKKVVAAKILAELKGGYTYKGRVLRPTLVKINKKEEVKEYE